MKPAIRAENLSKEYRLGTHGRKGYRTLRESLTHAIAAPIRRMRQRGRTTGGPDRFWALKDVSFQVHPGEVIGIIGRNGAGKSTLLKILSRIVEPTSGRAEIRGRIGSMLEVGTGFHPELTGRENVYLNGSILGMTRKEIDRKFDQIVAFSEVDRFLDTPVKRYSSGMYVRLAFAVAANLEPELLLVDEVLAVGDVGFQKRCLEKMRSITRQGRTVVFVSHNMATIENLCTRAVYMDGGKVVFDGDPAAAISRYSRQLHESAAPDGSLVGHRGRTPESMPTMTKASVRAKDTANDSFIQMNADLELAVTFAAGRPLEDITFGFIVKNWLQAPVFGANNLCIPSGDLERPMSRGTIRCAIDRVPLMPGTYSVDLFLGTRGQNFDIVHGGTQFEVHPADVFGSGILPPSCSGNVFWPVKWNIDGERDD